jgi:hypothetical protein
MARPVWPASSRTSRRLPPTCETLRAARVIKVRRPEYDERPSIFSEVERRWHHRRTVAGDSPPPRSEKRLGRSGVAMSPRTVCNATSAAWRSGCRCHLTHKSATWAKICVKRAKLVKLYVKFLVDIRFILALSRALQKTARVLCRP